MLCFFFLWKSYSRIELEPGIRKDRKIGVFLVLEKISISQSIFNLHIKERRKFHMWEDNFAESIVQY